jgi:hypothetical protein
MSKQGLAESRERFNGTIAPRLAAIAGVPTRWKGRGSSRFAYFADDSRFIVVAGEQEGEETDLALAYGLTYRGRLSLILVIPEQRAFSTLQRAPWFADDVRPSIWIHDGESAEMRTLPSRKDTISCVSTVLKAGQDFADELRRAATAIYLRERSRDVFDLVEWATKNQLLDPGHRKGERAWHCMGQKVLSIKGTEGGLNVRGGIHFSADTTATAFVKTGETLTVRAFEKVKASVEEGIEARLCGDRFTRPDEHWLQAVIRRDPSLVGVEQPALRELPAWRPRAASSVPPKTGATSSHWGRGYIDLVGVDGHGDLRLVETKLAENEDDRLILQGLDYYIWARAYEDILQTRLGTPRKSELQVHYVVGDASDGKIRVSRFTAAQANGLHSDVPWWFQTVRNWFHPDENTYPIESKLLPPRVVPRSE